MKKLLTITFVVFAFAACAKDNPVQIPAPQPAAQAEQPAPKPVLAAEYTFPALNGGAAYVLKTNNGPKPVLVASMAGFCGFCKKMIPYVDELAKKYKGKNVDIVIAFVDENPAELKTMEPVKAAKNAKVTYNASQFAQDSGLTGFPTLYLINNKGGEVKKWVGFDPGYVELISAEIDQITKK